MDVGADNFNDFRLPRATDVPTVRVELIQSSETPGGNGEVGVPLANAVFSLTGKRILCTPLEDGRVKFA